MCGCDSSVDFLQLGTLGICTVGLWRATVGSTKVVNDGAPIQLCRECNYDLHGLPTDAGGSGHCPECGTDFSRVRAEPVTSYSTHFHLRALLALPLILCMPLLPAAITDLTVTLSKHLAPTFADGVTRSFMTSYSAWGEGKQIVPAGAACAMAIAMLLSRRTTFTTWLARVGLSLVAWLTLYTLQLSPQTFSSGQIWRIDIARNAAPLQGALAGVIAVGLVLGIPYVKRAIRTRWAKRRNAQHSAIVNSTTIGAA